MRQVKELSPAMSKGAEAARLDAQIGAHTVPDVPEPPPLPNPPPGRRDIREPPDPTRVPETDPPVDEEQSR